MNQSDESMGAFFFNLFIGAVAVAAFYNIYKGKTPGAGAKGAKGSKPSSKSSGGSWFQGMGGLGQM